MAITALLLCICIYLCPLSAHASSTTIAKTTIDTERNCTLTLTFSCEGAVFHDLPVRLYQIATVSKDFQYTPCDAYSPYNLSLNGIESSDEWDAIRTTLEARIVSDEISADFNGNTDENGKITFDNLKPGLYLVASDTIIREDYTCVFKSSLISLPHIDSQGNLLYEISASPKPTVILPDPEKVERKVIKLWKGDEKKSRPESVEVRIFKNHEVYKEVILSPENNWSYAWICEDDGSFWTVVETRNYKGYTMTLEESDYTFVLTNTYTPGSPYDPPKTGDSSNIMLYVFLMILSGSVLVILGVTRKKNSHDE